MSGGSKNPEIEAERRRKIGEASRKRWADQEYKAHTSQSISDGLQANIEVVSQAKRKMWANPDFKNKMSEAQVGVWDRPGERKRRSLTHKARWENPLLRKQYSDKANENWSDPEFKQRAVTASGRAARQSPNKFEKRYIAMLGKILPGQWEFTGGGENSKSVGGKRPDFTHTTQKKIIELYGIYWHKGEDGQDRIDHYQKYGYDTLIIWEDEPLLSAMHKIRDFTNL